MALACADDSRSIRPAAGGSGWVLVWGDEFDGPAGGRVDTTRWRYDLADGCKEGICGWGNEERQYYVDAAENVSLDGEGRLAIVARSAPPALACYYGPCRYTSGKVTTRGKVEASPGRVEARIKLPVGQGLWSAFWLLGHEHPRTPWPAAGELDVMEHKGSDPAATSSAVHGPGYSGATPFMRAHRLARGSVTDEFHTYAVEWNSQRIRFFVDDSLYYAVGRAEVEQRGRWVFDQPFYVILNVAVGGKFDGDPKSDGIFPATMLVDWVRVYKAPAR